MTADRQPLAAFDDETFARVADRTDVAADRLRALTRRHQEGVRELPGVDDIVYEWRNHFHLDPLVHRTEAVYALALPAHVWEEFSDRLDLSPSERDALERVHDRQARALAPSEDRFDGDAALVLTRP
ncbi:MAG: hypothetical protein ABEH61_01305 [Haloarculaceae archaeon]